MISDIASWLNSAPLWGAVGVGVTTLGNMLVQQFRIKNRREGMDREAGFREMVVLVRTLREEMDGLRAALEHEHHRRRAAEEQVRRIREEMDVLRARLTEMGLPLGLPTTLRRRVDPETGEPMT